VQVPPKSNNPRKRQMRRAKAALTAASFIVLPATSAFLAGFGAAHAASPGQVSGLVFNDVDTNGTQAATGEPGVDGITVKAYTSLAGIDTEVGTATTAGGGIYNINLPSVNLGDSIKVVFSTLGTYQAVNPAQATQTVTMATGTSGGVFVAEASLGVVTSPSISVSIGDRIWIDSDGNGVQNLTEIPAVNQLGGISVDLLDSTGAVVANATTDQNGYYRFVDPATYAILNGATAGSGITSYAFPVTGGTYRVRVNGLSSAGSKLTGFTNTILNAAAATSATDSDGTTCASGTGTGAPAGTACDPVSADVVVPASTSYSNQTIDFGVLPYNYSIAQLPAASTVAVGGTASFNVTVTNLGPGSATACTIINLLPAGLTYAGTNPITGLSTNASFAAIDSSDPSKLILNCNARMAKNEAVTFTVNAIVGAGAVGPLKNFTYVADSTTDVAGAETISLGYTPTNASNAVTSATDNDSQASVSIAAGTASLGDKVWYDTNSNGVQDGTENPAVGVPAALYDATGTNPLGPTTNTDTAGMYNFGGLNAGTYTVKFTSLSGYNFTTQNAAAATDATDSDVNTTTGVSDAVTLAVGENNPTVDAGLVAIPSGTTASVGDKVWIDANSNGIQDGTELGYQGLTVTLYNATGGQVSQTTTDAQGQYVFSNLAAGSYSVTFTQPASGYNFTTRNAGTDNAVDSDADAVTGSTALFALADGQALRTIDAGLVSISANTASLGNYVWLDANVNGIQDATEAGLPNVLVTLTDSAGGTRTSRTDVNGAYNFANLPAGTYTVTFAKPAGYSFSPSVAGTDRSRDSNADVTTGTTATVVLGAGSANDTIDAGLYNVASIGDQVWIDANQDGIQNASETAGLSGVTVTLYDATGAVITTTTTDANGKYVFASLIPGTYSVGFSGLGNYTFTTAGVGTDRAIDSDAVVSTGRTAQVTIAAGQNLVTLDAGVIAPASTVTAATTVTATNPPDATTTTAVPATLPPGSVVIVTTPASSTTAPVATSSSTTTPGASSTTTTTAKPGSSVPVVSIPGTPVVSDPTCKINSVVWIDTNANGLVDAGEQVMPGVTVRVTAGGIVKEAVTDSLGRYSFTGIQCGDAIVEIISGLPAGTPLPAPKTIRVLGETAEAPAVVPFGVQLPTVEGVAFGGAESRQFFAAALTFLGMGGLLVSRKRKDALLRR
jgi:hypothetical protein